MNTLIIRNAAETGLPFITGLIADNAAFAHAIGCLLPAAPIAPLRAAFAKAQFFAPHMQVSSWRFAKLWLCVKSARPSTPPGQ